MYKELFHGGVLAPPAEWESVHTLTPPPHRHPHRTAQNRPDLHQQQSRSMCLQLVLSVLLINEVSGRTSALLSCHLSLPPTVSTCHSWCFRCGPSLVLSWSDTQRLRGGCTKARGLGRCAGGDVVAMVVVGMAVCLCGCPEWQGNREIIYTTTPNYTIQRCCWGGIRRLVIPRTQFD